MERKVVIAGMGTRSVGDNAAGLRVVETLENTFETLKIESDPQNHFNDMCGADVVVIVDAADFGGRPGEFRIIDESDIDNFTIFSRSYPLSDFIRKLKNCVKKVTVWGIQVGDPDRDLTPEVIEGVKNSQKLLQEYTDSTEAFAGGRAPTRENEKFPCIP